MEDQTKNTNSKVFPVSSQAIAHPYDFYQILNEMNALLANEAHPYVAVQQVFKPKKAQGKKAAGKEFFGVGKSVIYTSYNLGDFPSILNFCEGAGIHPFFLSPSARALVMYLPQALIDYHDHILRDKGNKYSHEDKELSIRVLREEYFRAQDVCANNQIAEEFFARLDQFRDQIAAPDASFHARVPDIESFLIATSMYIGQKIMRETQAMPSQGQRYFAMGKAALLSFASNPFNLSRVFRAAIEVSEELRQQSIREISERVDLFRWKKHLEEHIQMISNRPNAVPHYLRLYTNKSTIDHLVQDGFLNRSALEPQQTIRQLPAPDSPNINAT